MAINPRATRTVELAFETEDQARRFDDAMACQSANLPDHGLDRFHPADGEMDLALAIEVLAGRAVNARPAHGDPDAYPAKVEVQL